MDRNIDIRPTNLQLPELEAKQVVMSQLDFSQGSLVRATGPRIIIPVGNLGEANETYTVAHWSGDPAKATDKTGFRFKNGTDQADQVVLGDGTGVLVLGINPELTAPEATVQRIFDKISAMGGLSVLNTKQALIELHQYIVEVLNIKDVYDSDDKIADNLELKSVAVESSRPFGFFMKNDAPGPRAIFVKSSGLLAVMDGPHAGSATYPEGFLAVQIPAKKDGQESSYRSIAPEAVAYCYQLADGSPISSTNVFAVKL